MSADLMDTEIAAETMLSAAQEYAAAKRDELRLEDERPVVKQAAIMRVMREQNDLTDKPHSASSAEAVVELDEQYAEYRREQRDAVVRTIMARATADVARFRMWALIEREGVV